jgi:hypothetical protein
MSLDIAFPVYLAVHVGGLPDEQVAATEGVPARIAHRRAAEQHGVAIPVAGGLAAYHRRGVLRTVGGVHQPPKANVLTIDGCRPCAFIETNIEERQLAAARNDDHQARPASVRKLEDHRDGSREVPAQCELSLDVGLRRKRRAFDRDANPLEWCEREGVALEPEPAEQACDHRRSRAVGRRPQRRGDAGHVTEGAGTDSRAAGAAVTSGHGHRHRHGQGERVEGAIHRFGSWLARPLPARPGGRRALRSCGDSK